MPDERLNVLAGISKAAKIIPAVFEFVDIAGLVKGASTGEGLGNKFLTHIREVDAVIQVVRCFEDDDIHHVSGTVDPVRDIEVITTELVLADLDAVQKRKDKQTKAARGGDKQAKAELDLIAKLEPHLDAGKPANTLDLSADERAVLKGFFLLTSKPTLFACNVAEAELANPDGNKHVQAVRAYVKSHHDTEAVVISAQIESDLVDLSDAEAKEYLEGLGVKESGVGALIRAGLSSARPAHLFHHRREGNASVDHPHRRQGPRRRRRDPFRFRARLHRRRVHRLRGPGQARLLRQGARGRPPPHRGQGVYRAGR